MADAKALYKRHYENFKSVSGYHPDFALDLKTQLAIYLACILAEAIRNDMDEFEPKIKAKE